MPALIEHRLFALSPFLRQDMRHNRPVHVLPITDWHSQTGNQIENPYLEKQAGGGNRTRIISFGRLNHFSLSLIAAQ